MSTAIALIIGLVVALLIAGAWIAYVWKVQCARFETEEGLRILSGMRWRELSNLVVDSLAPSGFEREASEVQATRGSAVDVHVYRDGRPWILACRQGLSHVITRASVEEFTRSFRTSHAVGGLLVTPGRVDAQARDAASNVEVIDGDELWKLVGPLLPPGVHHEITSRARARALRTSGTVLAVATVAGLVLGFGIAQVIGDDDTPPGATPVVARTRAANRPANASASAAAATAAPMSEDEERESIVREIAQLPGVERALWSTRSTLQVYLNDPAVATDTAVCTVMKRYELLRASRLQIQSPAGAGRPVRFMQCAVY